MRSVLNILAISTSTDNFTPDFRKTTRHKKLFPYHSCQEIYPIFPSCCYWLCFCLSSATQFTSISSKNRRNKWILDSDSMFQSSKQKKWISVMVESFNPMSLYTPMKCENRKIYSIKIITGSSSFVFNYIFRPPL